MPRTAVPLALCTAVDIDLLLWPACGLSFDGDLIQGVIMNIYDFAMQMEKDGENYYRQLAAASKIDGLVTTHPVGIYTTN